MDVDGGTGIDGGLPHTDSLSDLMNSPVHTGVKTTTTSHTYTSGASPGRIDVPMMRSPGPGGHHLSSSPIHAGGRSGRLSGRVGYGSPRSFYSRTTPRNRDPDAPAKPAYGSFYRGAGDSPGPGSYNTSSYAYNKRKNAPKFSMGGRLTKGPEFLEAERRRARHIPGPGAYSHQSSFKKSNVYTSAHLTNPSMLGQTRASANPSFSFGTSRKLANMSRAVHASQSPGKEPVVTGPGMYQTKSQFSSRSGVGVMPRAVRRAPSFGFGSSSRF